MSRSLREGGEGVRDGHWKRSRSKKKERKKKSTHTHTLTFTQTPTHLRVQKYRILMLSYIWKDHLSDKSQVYRY